MYVKNFLKFVEIQTKVASITPFVIGTLFVLYRYDSFIWSNFLFMLCSLLFFDMATTAINNFYDYKKSKVIGTEHEKIASNISVVNNGISVLAAEIIIVILLILAVTFGMFLTLNTNLVVLSIGAISFAVGVLYTFGPIPISRMPLGEIFSGFFMGFIILFLSIYIHLFDSGIASMALSSWILTLKLDVMEIIIVFLVSIPSVACIANIMLANNICDIEEDVINSRFTIVYYLGKKNSLLLHRMLYYISYIDILALVIAGILPITMLFVLPTFLIVAKALRKFCDNPIKSKTFVLSVKNFITICGSQAAMLGIAVLIKIVS